MLPRNDVLGVVLEPDEAKLVDNIYHSYRTTVPDAPALPTYVEGQSLAIGVDLAVEVSLALGDHAKKLEIYSAELDAVSRSRLTEERQASLERATAANMLKIAELKRISKGISRVIFSSLDFSFPDENDAA